ncbi:MAG: hypothetical protein JWR34_6717 [Mycobacterium sp.]|nr:hypothetical protein [Mycobacterium sp.]
MTSTGTQLGHARVSTGHQSLDQQPDALTGEGIAAERIYREQAQRHVRRASIATD